MKIEMVPINKIKPYENNPRLNREAIPEVAESIKEYGFQQPCVLDKNYTVIVGHTRLAAAKTLRYTEIPCVIADDLTEEQVRSYRLSDNKTHERSSWDFLKLNEELDLIPKDMFTGFFESKPFDEINLDDLVEELNSPPLPKPKSEIPAPKRTTFVEEAPPPSPPATAEKSAPPILSEEPPKMNFPQKDKVSAYYKEVEEKPTVFTITIKTTSPERVALMEEAVKALMGQGDVIKLH